MDCNSFRKKTSELIEKKLSNDMKSAMENHMASCDECKKLYEEEKEIEELLIKSLNFEKIPFKSSRNEIIKNIDKNKYGKSVKKKARYKFMRNRRNVGIAIAIVLLLTITPLAWKTYSNNLTTKELATNTKQEETKEDDNVKVEELLKEKKLMDSYKAIKPVFEIKNMVKLKSNTIDKVPDITFGTTWKDIRNTNYEYSLDGKGPNVSEEGIAKLIVKDKKNNKFRIFQVNDEKSQKSPLRVIDGYENYALVIVGNAYGTIAYGGDLYLLNLEEGTSTMIYTKNNNREQIVDGNIEGNNLILKVLKFKDDSLNKFNSVTEKVSFEKLLLDYTDKKSENNIIEALGQKDVKGVEETKQKFMGGYDEYHKSYLGNASDFKQLAVNNISMNLVDYPEKAMVEKILPFEHKIYLVEMLKNTSNKNNKTQYEVIVVGRVDANSPWKVVDIIPAP